jgi:TRAP-type C4-dicarboxylate transport system permease small subunit
MVSAYYMTAVVFLPLAYVQRERGHVMIELFTMWVPNRGKAAIDGTVLLACAAALCVFTYATYEKAVEMTARHEIWVGLLDVYVWPSRWFLPIGLGLMALYMIFQSVREYLYAFGGGHGTGHQEPRHAEDSEQV